MRGIWFDGNKAVLRNDIPMPQADEGHSLIRILRAGVCSTDREILKGYRPDFRGVMGHEFVGVVTESSQDELIGKTVVGELNEGCGKCILCRSGREKHCLSRKVIGMSKDGCFAQYMTLADHLIHVVPEGLSPEKAVLTEPLAAALEIPERIHIAPGTPVAVIGDGRLAFMIAQVLHLTGTPVTVIGKHPEKLSAFAPYADTVLTDEVNEKLRSGGFTADDMFETVVDAAGHPSSMEMAMQIVRRQGTIILKSTYAGAHPFDMSLIAVNELKIEGSRCGPFEPALTLLKEDRIDLPEPEWHSLEDFEAAFSSTAFKAGFIISEL
ncbi:MAG: alcohol dehydrogenase catalytic domain-containing protein [Lachnospiraceae bacterium]|nr:alcohol dehydrogenase catalytic domain-containing protein [Lachnospiraceae bacterium]